MTGLFGFVVRRGHGVVRLYRLGTASGHLRKLQFLHWIRTRKKGREMVFEPIVKESRPQQAMQALRGPGELRLPAFVTTAL